MPTRGVKPGARLAMTFAASSGVAAVLMGGGSSEAQVFGAERERQQFMKCHRFAEPFGAADVDLDIGRAELAEALAAAAARRAEHAVAGLAAHHDDFDDPAVSAGDHHADGAGLGALALRVGGVLHIG